MIQQDDETLSPEEAEFVQELFERVLRSLDWCETRYRCTFCHEGFAWRHADTNVGHCLECDTTWIDDDDLRRLMESEESRLARLAFEHQQAHSEPLFEVQR